MRSTTNRLSLLFTCLLVLAGCSQENQPAAEDMAPGNEAAPASAIEHSLYPLPGMEDQVPEITRKTTVLMETTTGDVLIEVYPEAAPNAAARFIELVQAGYYDNMPISRVVPGFVAQFGVNWREGLSDWQDRNFDDDPSLFELARGTLAFAKAGPNTNSTQVFINYQQNNRLASPQYNFTTFGVVVQGMDAVDNFIQVGDPSGGLDQGRLRFDGEAYLAELPVSPSFIIKASVRD